MELDEDEGLLFLDVLMKRKPDSTLGHQVYRKKRHTGRYLHAELYHHQTQRQDIYKARIICEPERLEDKLEQLRTALRCNGYTTRNVK